MYETIETLNADTKAVTAFANWAEFEQAINGGYVPTIYGRTHREQRLIRTLKALGYRVWGNAGKNW